MANYIAIAIMVGIVCGQALSVDEDADRNLPGLNLPYGRGLVSIRFINLVEIKVEKYLTLD